MAKTELLFPKKWISHKMNIRHLGQLKNENPGSYFGNTS